MSILDLLRGGRAAANLASDVAKPAAAGVLDLLQTPAPRMERRIIEAQTRAGAPRRVFVNPTRDDLMRETRVPLSDRNAAWKHDTLRYIEDGKGNVYVANGADFIHDDIALALKREGLLPEQYAFEAGAREGHGPYVRTGSMRREGDRFISSEPGFSEDMLWPRKAEPPARDFETVSNARERRHYKGRADGGSRVNVYVDRVPVFWGDAAKYSPTVDQIVWTGKPNEAGARAHARYGLGAMRRVEQALREDASAHHPLVYHLEPSNEGLADLYRSLAPRIQRAGYQPISAGDMGMFLIRQDLADAPRNLAAAGLLGGGVLSELNSRRAQ